MAIDLQANVQPTQQRAVINDFALTVATKNGSGSQTSNVVIIRSLFRMGIPVSGKNLFPSNIKGLPTWYTIRASKDGYIARRATTEVAIAFNQDTAAEDIANLPSGGVVILPKDWKWGKTREDAIKGAVCHVRIRRHLHLPTPRRDEFSPRLWLMDRSASDRPGLPWQDKHGLRGR
ncbi:MAG: 2-oxoacid:acceptor oxidoreductase family protein [Anaerolinea sp.]|nr:2-oxoacid:acceptor oxidoreductase family protein [Anaerolinea sp.]